MMISKLLKKRVICKYHPDPGQRKKRDRSHRMILNLKSVDRNVEYKYFIIETVQTALQLLTRLLFHVH